MSIAAKLSILTANAVDDFGEIFATNCLVMLMSIIAVAATIRV